ACGKHDWRNAMKLVPPRWQDGARRQDVVVHLLDDWESVLDLEYRVKKLAVSGDRAIADVVLTYSEKNARTMKTTTTANEVFTYTMRRYENLWYVIPPGMEKVS